MAQRTRPRYWQKIGVALFSLMKLTLLGRRRMFVVLGLTCAVVLMTAASQARGTTPRSTVYTRPGAAASTFDRNYPGTGRLIVQRSADFGYSLFLKLWINGREVDNIAWNYRYDAFVPAGQYVVTVLAVPGSNGRRPNSTLVTIRPGRTYIFTGTWESDRVVLRRASGVGNW